MKIGINARLLSSSSLRGWNRYTINLLKRLPALGVQLFLYSDRTLHEVHLAGLPKHGYEVRVAPPMKYVLWEQAWLPKQCKIDGIDILHCPFNFGLPWRSPCPSILTLHDAIDYVYYASYQSWHQKLSLSTIQVKMHHWIARTSASHIVTVSVHSKEDLIKYLHIPDIKITVIYEAADDKFHCPVEEVDRARVRKKYNLDGRYFFYVGGWEKRKNIPFLLQAFKQGKPSGANLALAGGKDDERSLIIKLAHSLNIADRIKLLGWVPEDDLPALYAEALCFIYPSEYEGFGLQLCEAMAVGCPILAARESSLPEILGDGGETFAIDSPQELVALLYRIASDEPYRRTLAQMSAQRSAKFDWAQTAKDTLLVYQKCWRLHD